MQCLKLDPTFSELTALTENLNPFSTLFRYPEQELYPKKSVVTQAIKNAGEILAFVRERL